MQTFLCEKSFRLTAKHLDWRRLGKQRVEAFQMLKALDNPEYGWQKHLAVKMWRGHRTALAHYYNRMVKEWVARGYNNTMVLIPDLPKLVYPSWYDDEFIRSHRSNLLRKFPEHYAQFRWNVPNDLPYVWPVR